MTRSNNYRTNYSSISATETKIVSPKDNFCRQRVIDMRRYRNKLLILRARPQLKKQHQWPLWRFIDKTIQLNKLFIFTPMGMCRKGTAYIPVDTLDDW